VKKQPPKSLQEALVAGWREAEEGTLSYILSGDYRTLEGYIEFAMGVEPCQDQRKILLVPVKATLEIGKPYFEPERKTA
jgi:hypothetical protein